MSAEDGRGRRVLALALAASLLLHLLLVFLLEFSYTPLPVTYRVTFQFQPALFSQPPQPFAPGPPAPGGLPQPLEFPVGTGPGSLSDLPGPPAGPTAGRPELPGILSGSGIEGLLPPKPLDFKAPELAIPDFNALAIEQVRALAEEREGYARFRLFDFDADTTDAESRRRSRARQIVERAIEAMGGREALGKIREMKARVWIEASEHCTSGGVTTVSPYAYPVAIWQYTMQGAFTNKRIEVKISLDPNAPNELYVFRNPCLTLGRYYSSFDSRWSFRPPPTPGEIPEVRELQQAGRLREQGEAARWHFIDHFLGDGVNISYIGSERLEGRLFARDAKDRLAEVIQMEDERYGQLQEAFFDQETGLLLATVDGLTPEEQALFRRAYGRDPPVWGTTYNRYRPVRGVLTPHRLVRSGVTVHLKVAYNGEEPDPSIPDLEE